METTYKGFHNLYSKGARNGDPGWSDRCWVGFHNLYSKGARNADCWEDNFNPGEFP